MINKCILVGNVGKDPEVKKFDNGDKVANFPFATSDSYKDKNGEWQTITDWHNISISGGLVQVVENYVKKGSQLYLEGKVKTRSYEQEGQTKYITEIKCNKLQLLGSKNPEQGQNNEPIDDDLPF